LHWEEQKYYQRKECEVNFEVHGFWEDGLKINHPPELADG